MTFILPSFGASAISAVPASGGASPWSGNTYSVDFDGTDDYVSVPNLATYLTNNATAISISAWIKLNTTTDGSYEIVRVSDGSFGVYFNVYKSGSTFKSTVCGFRTGGAYNQIINTTDIFDGAWHHVVYTYDQPTNVIKGYIDGSLETVANTQASGTPAWSTYTRLDIGSNAGSSAFFDGLIDEVAVWPSVLSASDVTAIYNSGTPDDLSSYSPVGWWRMGDDDSGSGTTITDQGSGGNDGTLTNGPTFSTDVPVAPLTNTYSLEYDGTDDYAEVTGLGLSGATSLSAWFNPQASASYYPILHSDPNGIYILFVGGVLYVYLYDNTNGGYLTKNYTLNQSIGDWHHIVVTVDATSNLSALKLYIDGSEVSAGNAAKSGTYTSFNVPSSNPLDIGARTSTSTYANQLIDEVAIFGSELSSSDVTAIYNSGVPTDLASYSPVGWWRMGDNDSGTGTTITDQGSGGNDATLNNGPTFSTTVPS